MSVSAAAKTGSESSASSRIAVPAQRQPTVSLQLHQRADEIWVAERQVDRDRTAVAAPDHDRRSGCERVDKRSRVISLLVDGRGVRLRAFAPEVAAPVVDDRAPARCQLGGRIAPKRGGAPSAVKADDRIPEPCSS
jgi:hypothetical protein